MGKVFINNTSGESLLHAYFGTDVSEWDDEENKPNDIRLDEYQNDGYITTLEIRDARIQLEKKINQGILPFKQLPDGTFTMGQSLYLQPYRIQETEAVPTPDGFSMPITVHLEERYLGNQGWWIFKKEETTSTEVTMTARWENGIVRLYQGEMPPYTPSPAPGDPEPEVPSVKPEEKNSGLWASLIQYLGVG